MELLEINYGGYMKKYFLFSLTAITCSVLAVESDSGFSQDEGNAGTNLETLAQNSSDHWAKKNSSGRRGTLQPVERTGRRADCRHFSGMSFGFELGAYRSTFTFEHFPEVSLNLNDAGDNLQSTFSKARLDPSWRLGGSGFVNFALPSCNTLDLNFQFVLFSAKGSGSFDPSDLGGIFPIFPPVDSPFNLTERVKLDGHYYSGDFYFTNRDMDLCKKLHSNLSLGTSVQILSYDLKNDWRGTADDLLGFVTGAVDINLKQDQWMIGAGPAVRFLTEFDILSVRCPSNQCFRFFADFKYALLFNYYKPDGKLDLLVTDDTGAAIFNFGNSWKRHTDTFVMNNFNFVSGLKYYYRAFAIWLAYRVIALDTHDFADSVNSYNTLFGNLNGLLPNGIIGDLSSLLNNFPLKDIGFSGVEAGLSFSF